LCRGPVALLDGQVVAGVSCKVRAGEGNPSKRRLAQHIARLSLSVCSTHESGLCGNIMVSPAVQDNAGDIAPRVEPGHRKYLSKLQPNLALELTEGRG
jgi:hypothetical protein